MVEVSAPLPVPHQEVVLRKWRKFSSADWDRLKADLEEEVWTVMSAMDLDDLANHLFERVLALAEKNIRKIIIHDRKPTHPWLNDAVLQAAANKRETGITSEEAVQAAACSEVAKRDG